MANLTNNTNELELIRDLLDEKGVGGGVELPQLSNEGTADQLVEGKQLIDGDGNIVTGTAKVVSGDQIGVPYTSGDNVVMSFSASDKAAYVPANSSVHLLAPLSNFGSAKRSQVTSDATFTGADGVGTWGELENRTSFYGTTWRFTGDQGIVQTGDWTRSMNFRSKGTTYSSMKKANSTVGGGSSAFTLKNLKFGNNTVFYVSSGGETGTSPSYQEYWTIVVLDKRLSANWRKTLLNSGYWQPVTHYAQSYSGQTSIEANRFKDAWTLHSAELLSNIKTLGASCFENSGLLSISIPTSVTSIGDRAFAGCRGLWSINYQGTRAQWANVSKGANWAEGTAATYVQCTDGTVYT